MTYRATHEQHGRAILRALAYCLRHGFGHVTYEQVQGTVHGVPHGRVRFIFEVETGPMWRTATMLRERVGVPRESRER